MFAYIFFLATYVCAHLTINWNSVFARYFDNWNGIVVSKQQRFAFQTEIKYTTKTQIIENMYVF